MGLLARVINLVKADHVDTDPACLFYRRPVWVWERVRHERAIGKSCGLCMSGVL